MENYYRKKKKEIVFLGTPVAMLSPFNLSHEQII